MSRPSDADSWRWVFLLFAAGNLVNGVWMLADPGGWYLNLPAAVPDTGPLNPHFVRDIGSAFTMMGVALVWGAFRPALRVVTLGLTTVFYALHALVHVTDTLAGRLPPAHWAIDFPGVYLPAILLVAVLAAVARRPETRPR
jgi:hypothetical protein